MNGGQTEVVFDRGDHRGHDASVGAGAEYGRRVEAQSLGIGRGETTGDEIVFSERARDRQAGIPETQGERAHVALRLALRHCHGRTVMELPALKRLQHLERCTAGKAVEEDGRIAEPNGQAGRAIVMGGAAAFAAAATPHPAKLLDDVLGSDFGIER